MKLLLGLCALLFAGQSMATCNNATFTGSYTAHSQGTILSTAGFGAIASGDVHGDGTATVQLNYSIAGVIGSSLQTATYTVTDAPDGSGNCQINVTATFAGIPLTFVGYSDPNGDYAQTITTVLGTTSVGDLRRTN